MNVSKSPIFLAIASVIGLLMGLIFYAFYNNLILFRSSFIDMPVKQSEVYLKKKVLLFFYQNGKERIEEKELLWPANQQKAIIYLVGSWLATLDEEHVIDKKVTVQSVMLSPSYQEAYISFDRNPLNKESSTYEKLMWVESLLKTLRENGIKVQSIYFLVHHQPLHDYHLDFTHGWPVTGFQAA